MSDKTAAIEAGWKVVGSKGKFIGTVEAVRSDHIVVKEGRLFHHTLYIPVDHIATAADGQVTVTVTATEADAEGWRFQPNASFHHAKPAMPEVPETTTMQAAGMSSGTMSAPEVQGAVLDGQIDAGEVPDTQIGGDLTRALSDEEEVD